MNSHLFAHTAPFWVGARGSVDPASRREAAHVLLGALERSRKESEKGLAREVQARLARQYDEARARLEALRR
jgi:hypothetical protein